MCDSFTAPFISVVPSRDITCVDIFSFIGGIGPDFPHSERSCAEQAKVQWKGDHRLYVLTLMSRYKINLMITDFGLCHVLVAEDRQGKGVKSSYTLARPGLYTLTTSPGFHWTSWQTWGIRHFLVDYAHPAVSELAAVAPIAEDAVNIVNGI